MTPCITKLQIVAAFLSATWIASPFLVAAQTEGNDAVLRSMVRGLAAMEADDWTTAEMEFQSSTDKIAEIWSDTEDARKARTLWYEESKKPFKGEPYERYMAFAYRSLLFLQQEDYGNCQAAARQATIQDAFAEEEQHRVDVAFSLVLQWVCLYRQGSLSGARQARSAIASLRPDFPFNEEDLVDDPVLVIVETGTAPRKLADGVGSYRLVFRRGKSFDDVRVVANVSNTDQALHLYPIEDLYYQARTRGGRLVDSIIEGKATFASTTADVGTVLSDIAESASMNRAYSGSSSNTADAIGLAGVAALLLSGRARPAVDTRYWDNLPEAIHIAIVPRTATDRLRLQFLDDAGDFVAGMSRTVELSQFSGPVVWISAHSKEESRYD